MTQRWLQVFDAAEPFVAPLVPPIRTKGPSPSPSGTPSVRTSSRFTERFTSPTTTRIVDELLDEVVAHRLTPRDSASARPLLAQLPHCCPFLSTGLLQYLVPSCLHAFGLTLQMLKSAVDLQALAGRTSIRRGPEYPEPAVTKQWICPE